MAFGCPSNHRGCDQGRKLLAHYKRCKTIRAKQLGQSSLRREGAQPHVCLVCNLVARQARSVLDRPKSAASSHHSNHNHNNSKDGSSRTPAPSPAASSTAVRKTSSRRIISSFMLDSSNRVVEIPTHALMPSSPKMMPPPPPRARPPSTTGMMMTSTTTDEHLQSHHSFPPPMGRHYMPQAFPEPEFKEPKSVSFHGAGRGRAYSHSEGHTHRPAAAAVDAYCFQRPRSQSLGAALTTAGSLSHRDCDTIAEEGESGEFAEVWNNPAA